MFFAILTCLFMYIAFKVIFELTLVIVSRRVNNLVWTNIKDKYVFITGATDGIGKAIALKLAEMDQKLVLIGRNEQKLQETRNAIIKITKKEDFCVTANYDFSEEQDFSNLPDLPIGMLINNAGVSSEHPEFIQDEKDAMKIIKVNNLNLVKLTQICVPKMGPNTYIINISSGLADNASPLLAAYAASKAFVKHFSRSIHYELIHRQIFCQYVSPNMVSSKMTKIRPSFFAPSAEDFASAFVCTIGSHYRVSPYLPHTLQNIMTSFIPSTLVGIFMYRSLLKTRTKAIEKKMKNQ